MRYVVIILSLALSSHISAQNRIDSLSAALLTTDASANIIVSYNEIIKYYLRLKPDSAKLFIDRLSLNLNTEPIIEIMAARWLGEYYNQRSVFDSAIISFNKMAQIALDKGYDSLRAKAIYELGSTNIYTGDFTKAKQYLSEALNLFGSLKNQNGVEDATYTLAVVYMYEEKFESAISTYLTLDSLIRKRNKVDSVFLGSISHNIGYLYRQIGNLTKAMTYAAVAETIYKQLNAEDDLMLSRSLLAWIKTDLKDYSGAERDFLTLEQYYLANRNNYSLAEIYMGLGTAAKGINNCEAAIAYWLTAEAINRTIDNAINLASVLNSKGSCLNKTNRLLPAIRAFKEADSIASANGLLPIKIDAMIGLASTYYELKNFSLSSFYYREITPLKDSLGRSASRKNVEVLEAKYQNQKKEQEIELLTAQNKLTEQQRMQQLYLFVSILAVVLIVALFLFYLYGTKKKNMARLKELDAQKSKIFANISHEFRTPLTLIKGPVEDQLLNENLEDKELHNLQLIDRNATRLLSLVDQLLDLSKLEAGSMKLNVEETSLASFLGALIPSFKYVAEQQQIIFQLELPPETSKNWFDRDVIDKVVTNLLSNAIKYTPGGGKIDFTAILEGNNVTIMVKNTGKGIKNEEINKIFDRFYQGDATQNGVGIGLALVKELIALHKGSISLTSKDDGWTEFIVELPVVKHRFKQDELASTAVSANTNHALTETTITPADNQTSHISDEMPILLVVEDNNDLRLLIKRLFIDSYTVLEASDGSVGINKALEFIPDIIISDIMMPVVDGVTLSKKLKTDERTSHIPIILLTAKAGDKNEIQGLETGADDYMIKPFNGDVLKTRVRKLIELRARLRQRYSQELILRPKDIAISSTDEKFLERVQELLDKRLTDSSFNTEVFSREIGMSRMQLHRKIKAVIGLTTTGFVRSQRLKLAVHLLETTRINMSEVGYAVGFNDPSYFARCFKEAYDCTPSQYVVDYNAPGD